MFPSCRLLGHAALSLRTLRLAGIARVVNWLARRSHRSSSLLQQRPPAGKKLSRKPGCEIVYHFCTAETHGVLYGEFRDLVASKAIQLIDVREKWEIEKHGEIPGSTNIPLGELVEALQMTPEHFKKIYNQDMPSKSDPLVFVCMAGVRSKQALAAAKSLGYHRAQHYIGGFQEWAERASSGKT